MAQRLDAFLAILEQAGTLDDLQSAIVRLRDAFAIDHLVYHWVSPDAGQYGCGTYAEAWVRRYVEREYLRVDPVVAGCYRCFHPVDWSALDWSSKAARAFLRDAISHGVGNQGLSVPIRGPNGQFALFTASHSCSSEAWQSFVAEHRRMLILVAHYFNDKALSIASHRVPEFPRALSPREIDAMTLLAIGYSRAQVAQTLAISEHTLRAYIESARDKLGASNTTHAVARALSRGLIVV